MKCQPNLLNSLIFSVPRWREVKTVGTARRAVRILHQPKGFSPAATPGVCLGMPGHAGCHIVQEVEILRFISWLSAFAGMTVGWIPDHPPGKESGMTEEGFTI